MIWTYVIKELMYIKHLFQNENTNYKYTLHEKGPYSDFFWSVFSCIRTEYGKILRISPYSVWIRENADQKNSEYGHISHVKN